MEEQALRTSFSHFYTERMVKMERFKGFFEVMNIPYVGNGVLASSAGMDKVVDEAIIRASRIETSTLCTLYPYWMGQRTATVSRQNGSMSSAGRCS